MNLLEVGKALLEDSTRRFKRAHWLDGSAMYWQGEPHPIKHITLPGLALMPEDLIADDYEEVNG